MYNKAYVRKFKQRTKDLQYLTCKNKADFESNIKILNSFGYYVIYTDDIKFKIKYIKE